jgi:hypothetical protein
VEALADRRHSVTVGHSRLPDPFVVLLLLPVTVVLSAAACGRIVPGAATFVTPPGIAGSETSMAFSPGVPGVLGPTTIVQFNDFSGGSLFGWSWWDGTVWTYCNAVTPNCGGPGVTVPLAPGQQNWRGDPGIAAAPDQSGVVVATQLANSIADTGKPNMVVASLSFDGGRTFSSTVQVNSNRCDGGDQDQQDVSVDPTTSPPTFWFVWRHNGSAGTGAGTYGACVRGGTVNTATRTITWLGPAEDVEHLDRTPFWGVGGLVVQAGGGYLSVGYSNTDHIFNDCSGGKQVRWFTVTSANNGVDWGSSREVYDTRLFGWCAAGNRLLNTLRAFDFIRDATGSYWFALHDSPGTVRVFLSIDNGTSWTERTVLGSGTDLLFPTLATDPATRVGVSVNGTLPNGLLIFQRFAATLDAVGPTSTRRWLRLGAITPLVPVPAGTASRVAGDYNGAVGVPAVASPSLNQSFAVAYADTTPPVTRVAVVFVRVRDS